MVAPQYCFTNQNSESVTMDVTVLDGGMYLKANDGTYLFRGAAPEDMAAAVCADYGYPVKALAATGRRSSRLSRAASVMP